MFGRTANIGGRLSAFPMPTPLVSRDGRVWKQTKRYL